MSAFLAKEGCATVGFEKSMWTVTIDGARILLGAHIDDFVIACANRQVLDSFRAQDNVSLSTSEAEFVAASLAGQEAIYLRKTLTSFGFSQTKATLLYKKNSLVKL